MSVLKNQKDLLINIENNIVHLHLSMSERTKSQQFTQEKCLDLINIDTTLNKEIVNLYDELFKIYALDIDIINLIVKYITLCGKIIRVENEIYLGVKDLNWSPSDNVPQLEANYFISKYSKPKKYWKSDCYNKALAIFINILLPFTNKYCYSIYDAI